MKLLLLFRRKGREIRDLWYPHLEMRTMKTNTSFDFLGGQPLCDFTFRLKVTIGRCTIYFVYFTWPYSVKPLSYPTAPHWCCHSTSAHQPLTAPAQFTNRPRSSSLIDVCYLKQLYSWLSRDLVAARMLASGIGRRLSSTKTRMAGPKLTLYVDTVSPFAYEAYYILRVSSRYVSSVSLSSSKGLCLNSIWERRAWKVIWEVPSWNRVLILLRKQNDPVFKKCEISYIPIFLGGVMKACGNVPPISIKSK